MLQKLKTLTVLTFLLLAMVGSPAMAAVQGGGGSGSGSGSSSSSGGSAAPANNDPCHPELHDPPGAPLTTKQLLACENCKNKTVAGIQGCLSTNPIVTDLNTIVNFLAGAVGVITVAMIILGGIQYSMSRSKPEAVTAAKSRITNALIALVAFMLIYAFLQWLIPGGAFK